MPDQAPDWLSMAYTYPITLTKEMIEMMAVYAADWQMKEAARIQAWKDEVAGTSFDDED